MLFRINRALTGGSRCSNQIHEVINFEIHKKSSRPLKLFLGVDYLI